MKIERSLPEIARKLSFDSIRQVGRLVRDVRSPVHELAVFLGIREFEEDHQVCLRCGYRIPLSTVTDFRQAFWDCWVRDPYEVRATDRVIVDAGANIGCFSIYAASKAPRARIYALEPSRSNYARLVENVRMNRLETRIFTEPFGVAGQTGVLGLNTEQGSPYHSAFLPGGRDSESIEVRSLKDALDALVDTEDEVDLLKMDCEGGEMDCLLQADASSLGRVGRIAVEYHEWAGFDFDEMRLKLESAGFRLADRHHKPRHPTGTALFVRD